MLSQLIDSNPMLTGTEELAALINLPDEHFAMLSPAFYEEIERSFNDINNQLTLVKAMNLSGMKAEDLEAEYIELCRQLELSFDQIISAQKIDFIKNLLGLTYNAVLKAEGIAKRTITIPIEFCHADAKMPAYAHVTDSGMDVYALEDITIAPGETKLVSTGIKVAIPAGYELQVRPKSGRCLKTKLRIANTPGTIDAGYRDEIGVIIDNIEPFIKSADIDENGRLYNVEFGSSYTIGKGEKFAQLVLAEVPKAIFYQVENVGEVANDGRNGGFGSTGVK
jgi:dUTP pyrophosphatase